VAEKIPLKWPEWPEKIPLTWPEKIPPTKSVDSFKPNLPEAAFKNE
jgi:hypothetical protein